MSVFENSVSEFEQSDLVNDLARHVSVVLVKTTHSGNIGAVARAMKNMGFEDLRLVAPKGFPSHDAERRASGAGDVLDGALVCDDLDQALADAMFVVGASARSRSFPWPLFHPRDCASKVLDLISQKFDPILEPDAEVSVPKIALVFGQEASGLTNEELQRCNYHVCIPANPQYSSLNLAMAVQVLCYELRMTSLARFETATDASTSLTGPSSDGWDADVASHSDVNGVIEHFEAVALNTGFLDPDVPGLVIPRLRRLFQRAELDKMEVNILRGILTSIQKRI